MSVRDDRPGQGSEATAYRSSAYPWLLPWQVRERRFPLARLGRRGLDPVEVYAYLDRVAGDMLALYAEITKNRQETLRIKAALRCWQSEQARRANGERR
ncbi:DivIVA domain-containing protein [Micromonospora rhizosphaerae]|uniref:DivIVA domain-containing protein n=1 Tax=Micromonospora rhizosphaerae TaxID=568872 RepID=A0A1C6SKD1_9ACTN|nr:DivIVA domain-containing protein [Micromonospora rhizosphaerae]SCL29888.1 DivIVA domain-containing protein [Micromonospora rhizosphaerae]